MSEMVERVIAALNDVPVVAGPEYARSLARAAIEAMREPTEAMVEVGQEPLRNLDFEDAPYSAPREGARDSWRAMIDEALK